MLTTSLRKAECYGKKYINEVSGISLTKHRNDVKAREAHFLEPDVESICYC
jgi:hypothetical protein